MKKVIAVILIIAGMVLIAYPKLKEAYFDHQQAQLLQEWENSIQILETLDTLEIREDEGETVEAVQNTDTTAKELERMRYIEENMEGVLRIDRIHLNLPILKGATEKNLLISVSRLLETADPGEVGNYCIAGHRSRTYGRNFNRLDELREGDKIEIINKDVSFVYEVFEKMIVKPEDTWVLAPQEKDKLITLITCDYSSKPTLRLIVRGKYVENN